MLSPTLIVKELERLTGEPEPINSLTSGHNMTDTQPCAPRRTNRKRVLMVTVLYGSVATDPYGYSRLRLGDGL